MLEILFKSPKEAKMIYSIFKSICLKSEAELYVFKHCIKISPKNWDVSLEQLIIPGLVQFIIDCKEQQIMLSIIKGRYYFLEEEEQQQIIHIAQSIIEGEREDIPGVQGFDSRDVILQYAIETFLRPNLRFTFESFQKFRLKKYIDRLKEYIEVAIEEYKHEQEYQNFIQSLRDYLADKEAIISQVSIVHNKGYFVYTENKELTLEQLKEYIDRSFVYDHPMYIDKKLLAPLVSMAPNSISLYTNDPFDGMIQTIQNIFQERVCLYKLNEF